MPVTPQDLETAKQRARAYEATCLTLFDSVPEDPQRAHDLGLTVAGFSTSNITDTVSTSTGSA